MGGREEREREGRKEIRRERERESDEGSKSNVGTRWERER